MDGVKLDIQGSGERPRRSSEHDTQMLPITWRAALGGGSGATQPVPPKCPMGSPRHLMFRLSESEDKYKALRKLSDVLSKMETTFNGKEDLGVILVLGWGTGQMLCVGSLYLSPCGPLTCLGKVGSAGPYDLSGFPECGSQRP